MANNVKIEYLIYIATFLGEIKRCYIQNDESPGAGRAVCENLSVDGRVQG